MNLNQRLQRAEVEIVALKSLLSRIALGDGTVRSPSDGGTTSGVPLPHDHGGTGEGDDLVFTPMVYADWENSVSPLLVWAALDQLAERVQDLDSLLVPEVTMMMTGMEQSTIGTSTHTFKIVTKTADYTATDYDTVILCDASAAAFTVTLPPAADRTGKVFEVKKIDATANTVTIDGDGSETIDGGTTAVITSQYESITAVSDGAAWFIL